MKCIFIFHQMNVDVHPFLVIYTRQFNYIYSNEVNFYNINGFGLRKITLCMAFIISPTIIVRPMFDWVILDLEQLNNFFQICTLTLAFHALGCVRQSQTISFYFFSPNESKIALKAKTDSTFLPQ